MVWWLDEHGYQAVGTSLVVAALLSAALAVLKVVQDLGSTGGALLLTFAGVVVAVVGDHGQRRATTWFGVAVAAIGTVTFFASVFEPSSTTQQATTLILSASGAGCCTDDREGRASITHVANERLNLQFS